MEPIEVRLARIEEAIHHLKLDLFQKHVELVEIMKPVTMKVDDHHLSIEIIKRDRKWIYGILAALAGSLGVATKVLLHSQ